MSKKIKTSTITVISQSQVLFNHTSGLDPITAHQINAMLQEGYCIFIITDPKCNYINYGVYDKWEVLSTDIEDTGQLVSGTLSDFEEFKREIKINQN